VGEVLSDLGGVLVIFGPDLSTAIGGCQIEYRYAYRFGTIKVMKSFFLIQRLGVFLQGLIDTDQARFCAEFSFA